MPWPTDEIKQLVLAIQVAEKNVEISDNDYTPVLTLEQAKLNLAKLKLQLEQARQGLALQIRQSYTDWKQAEERIPVLRKGSKKLWRCCGSPSFPMKRT